MGTCHICTCPEMLLRFRAISDLGKSWREAPWEIQHMTALPALKHQIKGIMICNIKIIESPSNAVHVVECQDW